MTTCMTDVTVIAAEDDWGGSSGFEFSGKLDYLIDRLTQAKFSIPEEYRANAKFEIGATTSFDCGVATFEVTYERPMTDEDIAAAEAERQAYRQRLEASERQQLARLQSKYGVSA